MPQPRRLWKCLRQLAERAILTSCIHRYAQVGLQTHVDATVCDASTLPSRITTLCRRARQLVDWPAARLRVAGCWEIRRCQALQQNEHCDVPVMRTASAFTL